MKTWRYDAGEQTLGLASDGGVPWVVYWGPRLPDVALEELAAAGAQDLTGGMLDAVPHLSLCPEASRSFPGQPGLVAYRDGPLQPRFTLVDSETPEIALQDATLGLTLHFNIRPVGEVLLAQTWLEAKDVITLHHLSAPVLPGPQSGDILDFSGRWIGEFQTQRSDWRKGSLTRDVRTGRSGHEAPPLAFFPEAGANNTQGTVFGLHYGWSGGHVMVAEELADGRRQIQFGHASGSYGTGRRFRTAPLVLACSASGLNGCAVQFQRYLRRIIDWPEPDRPRPVHYNCWEAVYFDHRPDALKDIATKAADLGAERFVLDDGWFGRRDDDTSSLGDWQVDARKWPDGLGPFIAHVKSLGMTFGLWVEPEMVNLDSDLARAHPDWVLGRDDQVEGRQQRVLDMSRDDVRDHLFDALSQLLTTYDIEYLKWDHNRVLPVVEAAQTDGIYALLGRLQTAFPGVEIESCASGGGRIDAGIMQRTHRVWLSDSNDALERLRMQHNAALFLPACVTGSHVGPRTCHTSGRVLGISFRAWVAAMRHMGFEMDPRELTEDETQVLKKVTAWWKANRDWMMQADILRLDSTDPAVIAEQHLAEDGARFVVFAGRAGASDQILPRPLRLTGLEPAALYHIDLVNREDTPKLSRGAAVLKDRAIELPGAYLMSQGVTLPWSLPETMWVLEGRRT